MPRLLVAGDPRHGVVQHAARVAAAVGARVAEDVTLPPSARDRPRGSGVDPGQDDALAGGGPLHAQFTDRLWGATPEAAAERVVRLAAATPLTLTLHDLPQASDGPGNHPRRAAAYARVATAARGVAVSTGHEAALLRAIAPGLTAEVIPLPLDVAPPAPRPAPDDEVALLGFFYPGKGHAEAVEAVAELGAGLGVTVLGRASPGHDAELEALRADAARCGVRVTVTGYLPDDELLHRARTAAVPLVAHRHVSASGSVATWVAAGRRPLVPDTPPWREAAALRPGTLAPYPPGGLAAAIARARAEPASTWWGADAVTEPGADAVAAAHLAWWARVAW